MLTSTEATRFGPIGVLALRRGKGRLGVLVDGAPRRAPIIFLIIKL
jgi:hypothetical protein